MLQTFPDRVRFNWGFWDAYNHPNPLYSGEHFDRVYASGRVHGAIARQQGHTPETSDPAWKAERAAAKDAAAKRKAVRNARPERVTRY